MSVVSPKNRVHGVENLLFSLDMNFSCSLYMIYRLKKGLCAPDYYNTASGVQRHLITLYIRLTAVGTRCADHVTPLYPQKLALTSPTGGGRSVGIVRVRIKATEFVCLFVCYI